MTIHPSAATGFQSSGAYERGRPSYPDGAVELLAEVLGLREGVSVVELGAGTGKLTRLLLPFGARILAVEPVAGMREALGANVAGVRVVGGSAEAMPLGDGSADAVVAAQAFHWFDGPAAIREIARVLRPGGRLGLVWNARDTSVPWVAALDRVMAPHEGDTPRYASGAWRRVFDGDAPGFTTLEHRAFRYEQTMDADGLVDRILSVSFVASLPAAGQAGVASQLRTLVADLEEPFVLPYRTDVHWATRS